MTTRAACALLVLASCAVPSRGTVGAVFARDAEGQLVIHETPDGLAAHDAGLRPGDRLILVDGIDVRALDEQELRKVLGGDVGQPVKLTLLRGEEVVRVTLKRSAARRLAPAAAR
ncbi:MAG: PDZ domain-containing protein [Polyangiaceae bacterium]|nr:PDZ domain-containing protein [Polyangiaceae bacterium]